MLLVIPLPLTTPWLLTALILYLACLPGGIFVYAPAIRKPLALAESPGVGSALPAGRSRVTVIAVVITFLMVVKPALWG